MRTSLNCKHCLANGSMDDCKSATCGLHDTIYSQCLKAENTRLREALTPSPKTKYAYMGEFPVCGDDGIKGFVPWVTMKQIMAAILALATPTEPD